MRGIDLNSFDHFISQINGPDSERTGLATIFFPMNRAERLLDESSGAIPSLSKCLPAKSAALSPNTSRNLLRACNKPSQDPQATPEGQCAALNVRIDDSGVMTRHCWDYNCAHGWS
jgi:hypothetical protein